MSQVAIKSKNDIALMREAGRIVCEILDELEKAVAPGVTTWELDALAEKLIYQKGARPAFKGYLGFPCCLCASVNDEVVHGIPSKKRKLAPAGDLGGCSPGGRLDGRHPGPQAFRALRAHHRGDRAWPRGADA